MALQESCGGAVSMTAVSMKAELQGHAQMQSMYDLPLRDPKRETAVVRSGMHPKCEGPVVDGAPATTPAAARRSLRRNQRLRSQSDRLG